MEGYLVEKLVHGGLGLVHDGPSAILVPGVIPGEMARLKMAPGKKGALRAELIEVLEPSPCRVEPPCPLFGECGGCSLQHMDYKEQVIAKREIAEEDFFRLAKIKIRPRPAIASPKEYRYRIRIKLQIKKGALGFFAAGSRRLIPISDCLIAREEIGRAIDPLADIVRHRNVRSAEIMLAEEGRLMCRLDPPGAWVLESDADDIDWRDYKGPGMPFAQVNPEQNLILREIVARDIKDCSPRLALDLFAGDGNLTEIIAQRAEQVVAVDSDSSSEAAFKKRLADLAGRVSFENRDVKTYLDQATSEKIRPGLIVLDPPRTGAADCMEPISKLGPETIVYVSCDTATLARDLKKLISNGYRLKSLAPLDMFPQTAHIESVTVLERE